MCNLPRHTTHINAFSRPQFYWVCRCFVSPLPSAAVPRLLHGREAAGKTSGKALMANPVPVPDRARPVKRINASRSGVAIYLRAESAVMNPRRAAGITEDRETKHHRLPGTGAGDHPHHDQASSGTNHRPPTRGIAESCALGIGGGWIAHRAKRRPDSRRAAPLPPLNQSPPWTGHVLADKAHVTDMEKCAGQSMCGGEKKTGKLGS